MDFQIKPLPPRDPSRQSLSVPHTTSSQQVHTVSPNNTDMTRSPSIKILKAPESERELRQNHNEAIADYKERVMYERIMRGRQPPPQQSIVGAVRLQWNAPSSARTTAPRTLLSPQGYLIPVVSAPSEHQRMDNHEEEDVEDEGIFDFDL